MTQRELEVASIQNAYVELRFSFREPVFTILDRWPAIEAELCRALGHVGLNSSGISFSQGAENISEVTGFFRFLDRRATIALTVDGMTFSLLNANWPEASIIVGALRSALQAVSQVTQAIPSSQRLILAFHAKPRTRSNVEILSPLVRSQGFISDEKLTGLGLNAYSANESVFVDLSQAVPGGLFIRIELRYGPSVEPQAIADDLRQREISALEVLGLRMETADNAS
jgi:hypothetical protein